MYHVIGSDGKPYPADLPTLTQWAHTGNVHPDSVIIDTATGQQLRAHQLLPLQPIFAARYQAATTAAPAPVLAAAQPSPALNPNNVVELLGIVLGWMVKIIFFPIWILTLLFKSKPAPTCGMCGSFIGKNEKQIEWAMENGAKQVVCAPCSAAMRRKASSRAVRQKF